MDWNPWLTKTHENKGGADYLETYDPPTLLQWQTRSASPTEYEQELADALQEIFGEEVFDLTGIVRRLNESCVKPPEEGGWTETNFQSVMKRLGEWA